MQMLFGPFCHKQKEPYNLTVSKYIFRGFNLSLIWGGIAAIYILPPPCQLSEKAKYFCHISLNYKIMENQSQ
jgi:hypothetical protein